MALWVSVSTTDFTVGVDSFSDLEIRPGNQQNGFHYFFDTNKNSLIKRFVFEVSKTGKKTCCNVTFIEKDGRYTPRLEFSRRNSDGKLAKSKGTSTKQIEVSSRIDLTACHENLWALIDFIQSIREVQVPRAGLVAVSKFDKELLEDIQLNESFIRKVLQTFNTKEAQELLVRAKKDDVRNLHAAAKQAKNRQAVAELRQLVGGTVNEAAFQEWVKRNTWVFGTEYVKKFDSRRIGIHSEADFIVQSLDGFTDLIELKKADVPLFRYDNSRKCYYPSDDLSQVIGQAIYYIQIMEQHSSVLKADAMDVLKPRVKAIIGRSSSLNDAQKRAMRLLNSSLHGIEIITFDEVLLRGDKIISVYDDQLKK